MSNPLNPNTLLPMSLQVDKMEQTRLLQPGQQQGHLAQQMKAEDREKENRVNPHEKTENARVSEDNQGEPREQHKHKNEARSGENKEENRSKSRNGKGLYIDIKI